MVIVFWSLMISWSCRLRAIIGDLFQKRYYFLGGGGRGETGRRLSNRRDTLSNDTQRGATWVCLQITTSQ